MDNNTNTTKCENCAKCMCSCSDENHSEHLHNVPKNTVEVSSSDICASDNNGICRCPHRK